MSIFLNSRARGETGSGSTSSAASGSVPVPARGGGTRAKGRRGTSGIEVPKPIIRSVRSSGLAARLGVQQGSSLAKRLLRDESIMDEHSTVVDCEQESRPWSWIGVPWSEGSLKRVKTEIDQDIVRKLSRDVRSTHLSPVA